MLEYIKHGTSHACYLGCHYGFMLHKHGILIRPISHGSHQKIKQILVHFSRKGYTIGYLLSREGRTSVLTGQWWESEPPLKFYPSDDWKNFPQTSFWLHTFQTSFVLYHPRFPVLILLGGLAQQVVGLPPGGHCCLLMASVDFLCVEVVVNYIDTHRTQTKCSPSPSSWQGPLNTKATSMLMDIRWGDGGQVRMERQGSHRDYASILLCKSYKMFGHGNAVLGSLPCKQCSPSHQGCLWLHHDASHWKYPFVWHVWQGFRAAPCTATGPPAVPW